jgi:hypothetical protein
MSLMARRVGTATAVAYGMLWLLSAYAYFVRQNFDAMFALFVVAMPSSYIADELVHALRRMDYMPEQLMAPAQYLGMLILGVLQYFVLGLVVTTAFRLAAPRCVALVRRALNSHAES